MKNPGRNFFSVSALTGVMLPVLVALNGPGALGLQSGSSQTSYHSSQQTTTAGSTTTTGSQSGRKQQTTGSSSTTGTAATSSASGQSATGGTGEYTGPNKHNPDDPPDDSQPPNGSQAPKVATPNVPTPNSGQRNSAQAKLEAALAALEEAQTLLRQADQVRTRNRDRAAAATSNAIRHTQAAIKDVSQSK